MRIVSLGYKEVPIRGKLEFVRVSLFDYSQNKLLFDFELPKIDLNNFKTHFNNNINAFLMNKSISDNFNIDKKQFDSNNLNLDRKISKVGKSNGLKRK